MIIIEYGENFMGEKRAALVGAGLMLPTFNSMFRGSNPGLVKENF